VVRSGQSSLGIVTDMGVATELIRMRLRECDALILEANHDEELLRESGRPWSLKQRIKGRQGHLSNAQAAELLVEVAHPGLRYVTLAHLSEDCNRGDLALKTIRQALSKAGHGAVDVSLSSQADPGRVIQIPG
jgi:phosphoribosyl 1,2-cyclic phosphodiesterase